MRKDPREEQDAQARKEAEQKRKAELDGLRNVLATADGYVLACRLLSHCRIFESIWSPSAEIHRNAGRQDVGHWIFGEIMQAAPETLMKIAQDMKRDQMEEANRKANEERK